MILRWGGKQLPFSRAPTAEAWGLDLWRHMAISIRDHHQRAIDKMIQRFANDPGFGAMLVAGSVAKGCAREDSDLDVMLIATEAEYARRSISEPMSFCLFDVADYPGGYVDCKVLDLAFLREAADHGSEPARNAFIGAYPAFSRIDGIQELVERIGVYPLALQQERIDSFMAQIDLNRCFFWGEAHKRNDPYLQMRAATDIVLFGGRLILAHNRILFPCHKRLLEFVDLAPDKPAEFVSLAHKLLGEPTRVNMEKLCDCIENFRDWKVKADLLSRYVHDTELTWRNRQPAISDV